MTDLELRDHFAGLALRIIGEPLYQRLTDNGAELPPEKVAALAVNMPRSIARNAYELADEMMKVRRGQ